MFNRYNNVFRVREREKKEQGEQGEGRRQLRQRAVRMHRYMVMHRW